MTREEISAAAAELAGQVPIGRWSRGDWITQQHCQCGLVLHPAVLFLAGDRLVSFELEFMEPPL